MDESMGKLEERGILKGASTESCGGQQGWGLLQGAHFWSFTSTLSWLFASTDSCLLLVVDMLLMSDWLNNVGVGSRFLI